MLDSAQFDCLPDAIEYARQGFLPGGLTRNMEFLSGCVEFAAGVSREMRNLLFDPQTSGGLLFSVASQDAAALLEALRASGVGAQAVGEVVEKTHPLIQVR
jgi:selenide,water dikinase